MTTRMKQVTKTDRVKKQIIFHTKRDVDLYYKVAGKMKAEKKTFSEWVIDCMITEIFKP